ERAPPRLRRRRPDSRTVRTAAPRTVGEPGRARWGGEQPNAADREERLSAVLVRGPEQSAAGGEAAERVQDVRVEVAVDVEGRHAADALAQAEGNDVQGGAGGREERRQTAAGSMRAPVTGRRPLAKPRPFTRRASASRAPGNPVGGDRCAGPASAP